jgi:hypothetical protein
MLNDYIRKHVLTMTENPAHWQLCTTMVEGHDPFFPAIENRTKMNNVCLQQFPHTAAAYNLNKLPKDLLSAASFFL